MKYVIIGNSAAGIGCVEGIRQVDKKGQIAIVSDEAYHTYSRPLISYLLSGKTTEDKMKYRSDSFYEDNNVETVFGKAVKKIDKDKKHIILNDASSINYDKLMVATGSKPFIPFIEGLDSVPEKFTFMSLDSAKLLAGNLKSKSRVLVIGAGLIGLKCAEGMAKSVKSIHVIDLAPQVLSSILDREGAEIIEKHLKENNINIHLNNGVRKFMENRAFLNSGDEIEFDILVIAVGVRPNVKLLENIGAKINKAICVNEKMETSIPHIYSAGDCTESCDISSGEKKVMALLPNAYMQGEAAGINMAGGKKDFNKAIPMNAIGFFGKHIITAGVYEGDTYDVCNENSYKKMFFKDNLLKGYILIGEIERAGIYTSLIREKIPLDSIDFELICQKPGLIAFSREVRQEKLGEMK